MQLVLDELDAEAAEAHLQQDVVLGQAARDVAGLCQTIYETFPGLEQSVPCFEDSVLGPCSLRPAQMLELQVGVPYLPSVLTAPPSQCNSACALPNEALWQAWRGKVF